MIGWVVAAAAALAVMLVLPMVIGYTEGREATARQWLAQRGWRLDADGTLWRVAHEDDEGWWTGQPVRRVRSARHAQRIVR